MSKLEKTLVYDFDKLLAFIEEGVVNTSTTATLEESTDFQSGNSRCSVRVFERYSLTGSNRLSLSVTLFQSGGGPIHLSAITSGGAETVFFSYNTFGEIKFLDKFMEILCADPQISNQLVDSSEI